MIGYDDKTYDLLFYNDFSKNSAGEDYLKDASNLYGINGGMVPRWDCRYILHDLITKGAVKGDTDTSVKPDVIGDLKVSDEVKKKFGKSIKANGQAKTVLRFIRSMMYTGFIIATGIVRRMQISALV